MRLSLSASLLAIAAALAAPTLAHAQLNPGEPFDDDPFLSDSEIIVTGTAIPRDRGEIVSNVTAIDRDELVSDLQTTLGDTLDREPGVSTTFFGAGASRPVLRGLGAERVLVLSNGIGTIDVSAASPDHQVAADGIDAERIEILRGPAALAYGGQAIGGVVNVIDDLIATERPDGVSGDAFAAYNTVNDGLEGALRIQGAAGPLVLSGAVSARDLDLYDIPGSAESDVRLALEGEVGEDEDVLENSFVETLTVSGGASLVGERGFLGVSVRNTTSEYGLPGGHAEEGEGEPGEAEEEEENPFIDLEQTRIDVRGGYDTNLAFAQRIVGAVTVADYDHTEFEAPGEAGTIYETDGWEARLEATHAFGLVEGSVGVQALDKSFGAFGEEAFISPTDTDSYAVFIHERLSPEGRFGLEGGLRAEWVDYDNILFGERDFELMAASVGAHLHESDAWFVGVEASYTERAPNESELFAFGPHLATRQFEVGDLGLNEERGVNLEAAARFERGPLRVGVNAYATDFENFITLLPGALEGGETVEDGLPVFVFVQDGAEFIGGEIYADLDLDTVRLSASVDVVDGELDDGTNVPLLPPLTFNADVETTLLGWLQLGAAITVAGDQDEPGPGRLDVDGYTRVDFSAGVALDDLGVTGVSEGLEVFAQLRNAFDEDIRYATSTLRDEVPAPGRNLRVGVRAAF